MTNFLKYCFLIFILLILSFEGITQSCPATPNLIFNGAAQYNSSCGICDRHNNNPPDCSCPCGDLTSSNCSGYTACNGNEHDNSLDNNTNEFKLTHNCDCLGGSICNDV